MTPAYSADVHLQGILTAIGATALLVGTGIWLADGPAPSTTPGYEPTALADYDTDAVALTRGPFCDLLAEGAAAHALDSEAGTPTTWVDGDRLPGVGVVHEYGCRLAGDGTREAAAWILAPPVAPERADRLVDAVARDDGCQRLADAPAFGDPTITLLCRQDGRATASHRGLFGDAWLTCTLTLPGSVPRPQLLERAEGWCVAVAEAARR